MNENDSIETLRHELALLKEVIRDNERIWAGFREIEIRLIGAASPAEILALLVHELPRLFTHVTAVSLAYINSEPELSRLMHDQSAHFVPIKAEQLESLFLPSHRPRLGPCTAAETEQLFPGEGNCGSAALVPLVLHGHLVGSLNEMSREADHFNSSDATDLLEHLAAVLAMCLENALGRERLKQDGLTDPLTGAANRRLFERRLREETERCSRRGEPLACLLADIDHFKAINDRFGHAVGDEALRRIAAAIAGESRAMDLFARYGGEEFVLLLPDTGLEEAQAIAERLRIAVSTIEFDGLERLSISVGVACLTPECARPGAGDALLRKADLALYEAKAAGRNCVRYAANAGLP
jgi:diguanylate cyclase (GGDEF)-like protein